MRTRKKTAAKANGKRPNIVSPPQLSSRKKQAPKAKTTTNGTMNRQDKNKTPTNRRTGSTHTSRSAATTTSSSGGSRTSKGKRSCFDASVHIKILQKEVERERQKRRGLNLPEDAITLPVTIKQSFFRKSDKNETIRTGKWVSDLCARAKRSDNSTAHETVRVLHNMGIDVGKAVFAREQNITKKSVQNVRNVKKYDKWFMDHFIKLNLWVAEEDGNNIEAIDSCNDEGLKQFVSKILKDNDSGSLEKKYVDMLDAISFPWRPFNESFQLLCSFYMKNGNMEVDEEEDPRLFRFVANMRKMNAKGKLSKVQKIMLGNIGFSWEITKISARSKVLLDNKGRRKRSSATTDRGSEGRERKRRSTPRFNNNKSRMVVARKSGGDHNNDQRFEQTKSKYPGGFGECSSDDDDNDDISIDYLKRRGNDIDANAKGSVGGYMDESDNESDGDLDGSLGDGTSVLTTTPITSGRKKKISISPSSQASSTLYDNGVISPLDMNKSSNFNDDEKSHESDADEDADADEDVDTETDKSEGEQDVDKEPSKKEKELDGGLLDNNNKSDETPLPFVLEFNSTTGFPSRLCSFCHVNQSCHHCQKPNSKGKMIRDDVRICGKTFCISCRLKVGYESSSRCLDCYNKPHHQQVAADEMDVTDKQGLVDNTLSNNEKDKSSVKEYTVKELEKMDVSSLRELCSIHKIRFGAKRKPGCMKLLKEHFKL